MLPGMAMMPSRNSVMRYSYRAHSADTATKSSYTFSSFDIGESDSFRYVVVCVFGRGQNDGTSTFTACTVAGVSCTRIAEVSGEVGNGEMGAMFITTTPVLNVSSGDVVVTVNRNIQNCSIATYALYDLVSSSPNDTLVDSPAFDPSGTIDVKKSGILIAICRDAVGSSVSWTGVTEDYDAVTEGEVYSGGSLLTSADETRTVTANIASEQGFAFMIAAAWWP